MSNWVVILQSWANPLSPPGDGRKCVELWGCLACLYSRVGEPRMLQAACLPAWHTLWPLLSSVAPDPLRVSHHHPQQRVPTCLSTRGEQSQKTARTLPNSIILYMRAYFTLWEQFIRPSLKTMRTLVIRPFQGYGNTASLSYLDTRVRKPDCLHLPYINVLRNLEVLTQSSSSNGL